MNPPQAASVPHPPDPPTPAAAGSHAGQYGPEPARAAEWPNRSWRLSLAYDGGAYHGWQVQPEGATVQPELESRLRLLFRNPDLRLAATSRTDAGVHALDQHVSFSCPSPPGLDGAAIRRALNRWLPTDIRVMSAEPASPSFHARYDAWGKSYTYVIVTDEGCDPFRARFVWLHPRPLDLGAMRAAADVLVGEHDFASFGVNPKREVETTVRHLVDLQVHAQGTTVWLHVTGRSFLYKMVRSIVGFLAKTGRGEWDADRTQAVLRARNRASLQADTAPPQGLFLARVFFSEGEWLRYRPGLPCFVAPDPRQGGSSGSRPASEEHGR